MNSSRRPRQLPCYVCHVPDGEVDASVPSIRGFARIADQGDLLASAGVVSMQRAVWSDGSLGGPVFGAYCFKLAFTPIGAVGSASPAPHPAGAMPWTVMTAVPPIGDVITFARPPEFDPFSCPEDHRDAAVIVRGRGDHLGMPIGGSVFVLFF